MCVFYRGQGELKIKPKDDQSYIFHAYTDTYCFYVKHHFEENGNQPIVNRGWVIFSFIMVHCMIYTYIECIQLKMCCDKMHLVYQKNISSLFIPFHRRFSSFSHFRSCRWNVNYVFHHHLAFL